MIAQHKPIIVLDAGHGGSDPGAVGNGLKEKDINLQLAQKTGAILEKRGAKVLYTRSTDVFIPLEERAKKANEWGADLLFSFHVNSSANPVSGYESFVYTEVNGGKTAAYQNVIHRKVAAVFASEGVPDRGQKKANLAVLRETNMPACLAEYGFINSAKDASLLKNDSFLDRLASATADGISAALGLPPAPKEEKKIPTVQGFCNVVANGKQTEGLIIDGRSYIPAREVTEILGIPIAWNGITKTVTILTPKK